MKQEQNDYQEVKLDLMRLIAFALWLDVALKVVNIILTV